MSLVQASFQGNIEEVRLQISKGTDVNAAGEDGFTPLHAATVNSRRDVLEFLVAQGADVDAKGPLGRTPLHFCRKPFIAELLVAKGADVNEPDEEGCMPLHVAALDWECV